MSATDRAAPIEHIAIVGSGLAAQMTAAAMSHQLPPSIRLTLVLAEGTTGTDIFYGSVSAPTAYAFNLSAGVQEPNLVLDSDTAFSWGTKYARWAGGTKSWIQCFHLALPVIDGVLFHHYLAQQGDTQLDRYLVSAAAARSGVFMHPPQRPGQGGQQLLARAEYGYQFDPASYARLFGSGARRARIDLIEGALVDVRCSESRIASVHLADGRAIEADLFIDCTGPEALLLSRLGAEFFGTRRLRAAMTKPTTAQLGPPVREVSPRDYGWRAETPLRGSTALLTVYDPRSEDRALEAHGGAPELSAEVTVGRRTDPWLGNCAGIGHAARIVEPLTPAPLMLLERDIERLMSLIPVSDEMSVERREFNRRFTEDHEHAELFTRALFETGGLPDTPYWREARAEPLSDKLARKIELFEDRGFLVAYDLEPFHPEDWTILHYGMGRRASRYDRTADRAPSAKVQSYLAGLRREVDKTVAGLPSHAAYMAELSLYLKQNRR